MRLLASADSDRLTCWACCFGADEGGDARLGGTFAIAVLACILGVVHAAAVFVFARSAGDGLLYKCCNTCMAMNNESNAAPNSAAGGTAAYNTNQQQPVR